VGSPWETASKWGILVATYLQSFQTTDAVRGECALAYARVKGSVPSATALLKTVYNVTTAPIHG